MYYSIKNTLMTNSSSIQIVLLENFSTVYNIIYRYIISKVFKNIYIF